MQELWNALLVHNLIELSEDGDKGFGQYSLGYFVTPEAGIIIRQYLQTNLDSVPREGIESALKALVPVVVDLSLEPDTLTMFGDIENELKDILKSRGTND